jgi:hypothetical protein
MSERRKSARKSTNDYFLVYNDESSQLLGRLMDLNAEGMMLICEAPVYVSGTFKCKLVMPRMIGRYRHVHFEAECKWCRKNPQFGWFEAGYQLSNLSDENWAIIEHLIEDWAEKGRPSSMTIPAKND